MSNRRTFIKSIGIASLAAPLMRNCLPDTEADDYWTQIKMLYHSDSSSNILNFNTGSACIMPKSIQDSYLENITRVNSHAAYEVKDALTPQVKAYIDRLALLAGCEGEDLALVRNTTEAINAVLYGIDWNKGDEVLVTNLDYPAVLMTLRHLADAKGIVLRKLKIDPQTSSPENILSIYSKGVTPKTRLMLITYMTHREGLILPTSELCTLAKDNGVKTLVDAAHALGQINHSIEAIGCDYYATSLHKWLYAPLGSGLLYVNRADRKAISPPNSYNPALADNMDKFSNLGTLNFAKALTLEAVLDFQEAIGVEKKYLRLKYLQGYFFRGLQKIKNIIYYSQEDHGCGIVSLGVEGLSAATVRDALADKDIHVKLSGYSKNGFIRVTLNLHLVESDIDRLLQTIEQIAS